MTRSGHELDGGRLAPDRPDAPEAPDPDPESRLRVLLPQVHSLLLRAGHEDLARLLPLQVRDEQGAARVVVAGGSQRGKSSLVNALVGRPGLSPVGVGTETSCYLSFRAGTSDAAHALLLEGQADLEPDPGATTVLATPRVVRRPIPLDALDAYATAAGDDERRSSPDAPSAEVVGVEVVLDAPVLDGIELVDTPGVDSLGKGHGDVTLSVLGGADALVFVLDGSGPVLAPEADFLAAAFPRVGAVLVVVTKSDAHSSEHLTEVIDASRESLRRRSPGLGEIAFLPVSARRAELAATLSADRAQTAQVLRELSGMALLQRWLVEVVRGRASVLRGLAAARTTRAALLALRSAEASTAAAVVVDPARLQTLLQERARLQACLVDRGPLQIDVSHLLQRMQVEPRRALERDVRQLREEYRERATHGPKEGLRTLPRELQQALGAAAVARLEDLAALATSLGEMISERLGHDAVVADVATRAGTDVEWDLPGPGATVRSRGSAVFSTLGMFGLGSLLQSKLAAVPLLGFLGTAGAAPLALTLGAAAGVGWWRARSSDLQQQRTHTAQWVTSTCAECRALFAAEVEQRVMAVKHYTDVTLPRVVDVRLAEIRAVTEELKALDAAGRGERARAAARHAERLEEIDSHLARVEEVVDLLAAAALRPPPPAQDTRPGRTQDEGRDRWAPPVHGEAPTEETHGPAR